MKTKQFALTSTLVILSFFVNAQVKYDYTIIEYNSFSQMLSTSPNAGKFSEKFINLSKDEQDENNSGPLLKEVKVYQDSGWEVMSFNTTGVPHTRGMLYVVFLRKKTPDEK
jgi:hypothetical protein